MFSLMNLGSHVASHPIKTESDQKRDYDFKEFEDLPLITNNESTIRREFFKEHRSTKTAETFLRFVARYVRNFQRTFGRSVSSAQAIDWTFCSYYVLECHTLASAASKVRLFFRLLTVIGVPSDIFPPNPYAEPGPAHRDVVDEKTCRAVMKLAKEEAQIIRKRFELATSLAGQGRDPRKKSGGQRGDWNLLENRLWFCREVLEVKAITHEQLVAEGHKQAIAAMAKAEGVQIISPTRGIELVKGVSAHLRFYHPSLGDLLPFIVMFLIRSMVNLQSVADIQASGCWSKPYPFALDASDDDDRYVMMILSKSRGAQAGEVADAPAAITFPSLKKPQSYPYQILEFVKELTEPLRREVARRIEELHKPDLSAQEWSELERLLFIKDDLFIYKTDWQITSLRWVSHRLNDTPRQLLMGLRRYGLKSVRELRDAGLHFSFKASSYNLVILHMLARHSSQTTARDYARRRPFFQKSEDLFVAIFDRSVELVRAGRYSLSALRKALKAGGLEDWHIANILNPQTETRWGNRCADPTNPPIGFNDGPAGTLCRKQDCIDGCRWARFLPDSLPTLVAQEMSVTHQLNSIGAAKEIQNTLSQRQKNLERILGAFPKKSVALERRRQNTPQKDC